MLQSGWKKERKNNRENNKPLINPQCCGQKLKSNKTNFDMALKIAYNRGTKNPTGPKGWGGWHLWRVH